MVRRERSDRTIASNSETAEEDLIEIPLFYGEDLESWLSWIEDFVSTHGFSDFETHQFAYGFIEGDAYTWYCDELSRSVFRSWEDLKRRLLHRFGKSVEEAMKQQEDVVLAHEDDSNRITSHVGGSLKLVDHVLEPSFKDSQVEISSIQENESQETIDSQVILEKKSLEQFQVPISFLESGHRDMRLEDCGMNWLAANSNQRSEIGIVSCGRLVFDQMPLGGKQVSKKRKRKRWKENVPMKIKTCGKRLKRYRKVERDMLKDHKRVLKKLDKWKKHKGKHKQPVTKKKSRIKHSVHGRELLVELLLHRTKKTSRQIIAMSSSVSVPPVSEDATEDFQSKDVSGDSLRRRFLEFYASRGHKVLPSASLVPDDPTVLLTIAGMLQFTPIFRGKVPRQVPCATTAQRCIRTNDLENVRRTARHHTFLEMLGNFSFGDYFKKEALRWAWELSTVEFGLLATRVWVNIFEDNNESFEIWKNAVGVPVERIKSMGEEDNFWISGPTGPCGPCSALYYDFYLATGSDDSVDLGDDTRFIAFYKLVFMQYIKTDDGLLEPLKQKNIDTGLGLERIALILQKAKTSFIVIADHMRTVVYLISDGVSPSNIGRDYVVKRLIRRAVRKGKSLGINGDGKGNLKGAFLPTVAAKVLELRTYIDSDIQLKAPRIIEEIWQEELHFQNTLERGDKLFDQKLQDALSMSDKTEYRPCISGKDAFFLYIEDEVVLKPDRGIETRYSSAGHVEDLVAWTDTRSFEFSVKSRVKELRDATVTHGHNQILYFASLIAYRGEWLGQNKVDQFQVKHKWRYKFWHFNLVLM